MPTELRELMQVGEHIASDKNILDFHICQQPISYVGNTGIQISQEKAINTLFNISRMEIDNLCLENIRQVLRHDSEDHNLDCHLHGESVDSDYISHGGALQALCFQ